MASYQVPQFLDSGEKILYTMNIRQFAYALGAFGLCVFVFSLVSNAIPGIGYYAIIPCIPIIGLGAYLAIGKFNGRDAEIFVLKFILFVLKPRTFVFVRQPDFSDIIDKYKMFSQAELEKKYSALTVRPTATDSMLLQNMQSNSDNPIAKIISLSRKVDNTLTNSVIEARRAASINEKRKEQIQKWNKVSLKK